MIRVFIGSSKEQLWICNKLEKELKKKLNEKSNLKFDLVKWCDAFPGGEYTLDVLLKEAQKCQCAIFILAPDDFAITRAEMKFLPRDNVLFESGMFMGVNGKVRTCLIQVNTKKEIEGINVPLKILSDISGIGTIPCEIKKGRQNRIINIEKLTEKIWEQFSQIQIASSSENCKRIDDISEQIHTDYKDFLFADFIAKGFSDLKNELMFSSNEVQKLLDQVDLIEDKFKTVSKITDYSTSIEMSSVSQECIENCKRLTTLIKQFQTLSPQMESFLRGYALLRQFDTLWYQTYYNDAEFSNGTDHFYPIKRGLEQAIQAFGIDKNNEDFESKACLIYIYNLICTYLCKCCRLSGTKIDNVTIEEIEWYFDQIEEFDSTSNQPLQAIQFSKSTCQHIRARASFYTDCAIKREDPQYEKKAMEWFEKAIKTYPNDYKTYDNWIASIIKLIDDPFDFNYEQIAKKAEKNSRFASKVQAAVDKAYNILEMAENKISDNRWKSIRLNIAILQATLPSHRDEIGQCEQTIKNFILNEKTVNKYTLLHFLQLKHFLSKSQKPAK